MIARRAGLAALMICTLLPIALSATGSRLVVVTGAVFVCIPLLLASALAWTGHRPGRQVPRQARALREKRIVIATCLFVVALIPATWWPLRLAFALSRPTITRLTTASLQKAHRDRDIAIEQERKQPKIPASTCEGMLAGIIHLPAYCLCLPSEDLHERGGTFALREVHPLDDYACVLHVEAVDGTTDLVYHSDYSPPASFEGVPLGDGWWFVSD